MSVPALGPERVRAGEAAAEAAPLELRDLRVAFGGNVVLDGVSVAFRRGMNGLVGPNGAGKTTAFNVVSGFVAPRGGQVLLEGRSLLGEKPARIGRLGVGRTFQSPRLIQDMSLVENVMLGYHRLYGSGHVAELLGLRASRRDERLAREASLEALASFGLDAVANEPASQLSLGSQKIAELARAIVGRPKVVLLDEPAAGLSAGDADVMVAGIEEVVARSDLTVVIIEHDLHLVARLCQSLAVLHFGRIIAEGRPEEVVQDPVVVEAYLGTRRRAEEDGA